MPTAPAGLETTLSVTSHVLPLDGLRGVAVLLILAMHCFVRIPCPAEWPVLGFLQQALSLCYCGVDLFFVLSGFLIGGVLLDHRDAPNLYSVFYRRRSFRLLPLYFLLLASFYAGRAVPALRTLNFSTYFDSSVPLWSYWSFTQNIAMAWQRDIGSYWLGPTWSLGVEEQFYLVIPVLVRLFDRRQLAWFCALAIVISPGLRLLAWHGGNNQLAAIFLAPMRADSLLLGVLCAIGLRMTAPREWLQARRGWILAATVALGCAVGLLSWQQQTADSRDMVFWGYSVVGLFFTGCLLLVLLYPASVAVHWLAWRPLVRLGLISYFIYLAHLPVWYVCHWVLRGRPPSHLTGYGAAVTLLSLGLTLLLGLLSRRYFEGPLLDRGRGTKYLPAGDAAGASPSPAIPALGEPAAI
ncbi:MAG: acyltransferase family protein [Opitutales bacterium]